MSTNREGRAWLQVRSQALLENLARLQAAVGPDPSVIPMVKADAYGLGMDRVVETLRPRGPWGWGVATLAEGLRLREELSAPEPVIVFSPLVGDEVERALRAGLQVSVSSLDALAGVVSASKRTGARGLIHVDVDTGIGRTGFDWGSAAEWMPRVREVARGVEWVGCFTHLHSAEDDEASVKEQWARFEEALSFLVDPPPDLVIHALNSAGAFAAPERARDAVRPGIFLYGGGIGSAHPAPAPVVSLHARVCHIRDVKAGTTLGYGATYRASGPERWATLSIGYGDGLPRMLGNRGSVLLRDRRVPIIGRISMDLTVVDITDLSGVQEGDIATLLGAEGQESITLDEIAALAGTISYEILTGFTPRLPRIWS